MNKSEFEANNWGAPFQFVCADVTEGGCTVACESCNHNEGVACHCSPEPTRGNVGAQLMNSWVATNQKKLPSAVRRACEASADHLLCDFRKGSSMPLRVAFWNTVAGHIVA